MGKHTELLIISRFLRFFVTGVLQSYQDAMRTVSPYFREDCNFMTKTDGQENAVDRLDRKVSK